MKNYPESQPHAAYCALAQGLSSKWNFLSRTLPEIHFLLQPLEDAVKTQLLPKLSGREAPNDLEMCLFALPTRLGGLNLMNPVSSSNIQHQDSLKITKSLVDLILSQSTEYPYEVFTNQITVKIDIKSSRKRLSKEAADELRNPLPSLLQCAKDLSMEKGASSWLTVLLLEEHNFSLHKQALRDALALRYGWLPSQVPSNCPCDHSFSTQHVLSYKKGRYPSIRQNELRDVTASLLSETCHGVAVEPSLQSV